MTVTLSQKSYNALLDDLEKLRKCNIDLEEKLNKEIKLSYEIEGNLYDVSKERDKIINDMAEVKRKAEAFNEIKEYTLDKIETLTTRQEFAPNSNKFEYFGNLLTAFKAIKYKISDLERGSDE
ncbi:hypothetical protein [Staphylococcus haemolyticus]|uniref:hypothetical protein n=1 Tax=Staphylococcus haemolyticus TaxID=1283 RepID=UPI0029039D1B|nr:hypothetical protein [Staphylococcus haemolyticus]MDU0485384.1 hypothetical protein [Staphylococcus haemolyticus]